MKIYNYHPGTLVYVGSSDADESPLEPGVFLVPSFSTPHAPPEVGINKQAVFNILSDSWEVHDIPQPEPEPEPSLEEVKLYKKEEINNIRDFKETEGVPYLDKVFDSDPRSVQRITSVVQLAQISLANSQPFSIDWTVQDNTIITLDALQMIGLLQALVIYAGGLHEHAKVLKAQVDSATTKAQVEAITWE